MRALAASCLGLISLVIAQAAPAAETAATAEDTMAQRMQACVVCHGKEGRATNEGYFPRIAGKPAGYLYNQLQNFKARRRHNAAMNYLLRHLSDAYLRDIAAYFSALDLPYPPAEPERVSPEQQQVAARLVYEGAPERQLPACVSCHGAQMAGMLPATPGLLALPADYLIAQLGGWRTGQRQAMAPDCMAHVANRLTAEEISAVSHWLSARAPAAGTQPAPAPREALPLRCGSSPQ